MLFFAASVRQLAESVVNERQAKNSICLKLFESLNLNKFIEIDG